ncbi:MAG: hypothetical protein ACTHN5_13695 [Phycisphaerae bacterium]
MTQVVATPSGEIESAVRLPRDPSSPNLPDTAPRARVRLNAFQRLMRRWSHMHPYNAGQVMEVSGVADIERWKRATQEVLGEMGLGPATIDERDEHASFFGVPEVAIEESGATLAAFFEEELNRPFAAGDVPVRFCVLPYVGRNGSTESHYFAAVYDHWIADSRAMRELMHRIFERYRSGETKLAALTLEAPSFRKLFQKHVGRLVRCAALRESLKNCWRHRRGFRINIPDPLDFHSRFLLRQMPEGLIERVHAFAKQRGASVNDMFIAVLSQTMGVYTHEQRLKRRKKKFHFPRRQVGIGTIVDIRDAASEPLDRVFNLYLSSYTVVLDQPERRDVDAVTREVASTTSRLKKSFATVKGFWAFAMARIWWDMNSSPRNRALLLHKMVPVVAGISNVKMTGSWVDRTVSARDESGKPRVLDYLRISPTGPLIPLVFTLTTIGQRLSLCVTYRTTAFSDEQAREIVGDFVERLQKAVG